MEPQNPDSMLESETNIRCNLTWSYFILSPWYILQCTYYNAWTRQDMEETCWAATWRGGKEIRELQKVLSKQRRSTREPEIALAMPRFIISSFGLPDSHRKSPVWKMQPKGPRKINITEPDKEIFQRTCQGFELITM